MQPRQKARVLFPTPFLMDFISGRGFEKIVFSSFCEGNCDFFQKFPVSCLNNISIYLLMHFYRMKGAK